MEKGLDKDDTSMMNALKAKYSTPSELSPVDFVGELLVDLGLGLEEYGLEFEDVQAKTIVSRLMGLHCKCRGPNSKSDRRAGRAHARVEEAVEVQPSVCSMRLEFVHSTWSDSTPSERACVHLNAVRRVRNCSSMARHSSHLFEASISGSERAPRIV
jgi:hypothetical protein